MELSQAHRSFARKTHETERDFMKWWAISSNKQFTEVIQTAYFFYGSFDV